MSSGVVAFDEVGDLLSTGEWKKGYHKSMFRLWKRRKDFVIRTPDLVFLRIVNESVMEFESIPEKLSDTIRHVAQCISCTDGSFFFHWEKDRRAVYDIYSRQVPKPDFRSVLRRGTRMKLDVEIMVNGKTHTTVCEIRKIHLSSTQMHWRWTENPKMNLLAAYLTNMSLYIHSTNDSEMKTAALEEINVVVNYGLPYGYCHRTRMLHMVLGPFINDETKCDIETIFQLLEQVPTTQQQ